MAKDHPTGQSGLYEAFLQLKTPEQCYRFLQDVCSYSELMMALDAPVLSMISV